MGIYCIYSIPGKTAALVSEFVVEDLPSAKLQHGFLCLQSRTCPWAETLMMIIIIILRHILGLIISNAVKFCTQI